MTVLCPYLLKRPLSPVVAALATAIAPILAVVSEASAQAAATAPATAPAAPAPAGPRFTARFTPEVLTPLLTRHSELLPLPFQFEGQREAYLEALERINMAVLLQGLDSYLNTTFAGRFDPQRDIISVPVPRDRQATVDAPGLPEGRYTGPSDEVVGFLLHDLTQEEYVATAIRVMQRARQLLDSGNPLADRRSPDYYQLLARNDVQELQQSLQQQAATAKSRAAARQRIGEMLGISGPVNGQSTGEPAWVKESRRFSHIVKDGKFVERLQPLVDQINREIELAGFPGPSPVDRPGIHFDTNLSDVEIVLPRELMETFLTQADILEKRMADDRMISIEAVRLTDRDIMNGALAMRLNVAAQGVHDVLRWKPQSVIKQVGLDMLLAVANRELSVANLREIEAGAVPAGTPPVQIPPVTLPPLRVDETATTVGSNFGVGADDIFFDGREQTYGFSYISPDGIKHTFGVDVVDSLRDFWDRIERNLIVHKIQKGVPPIEYTVPVGPKSQTFPGIAALISQEDRELIVATGTGAISQLQATAGTWLIIQDFEINPIPGSSTALSEEERKEIRSRILFTMFLRDPSIPVDAKVALLETESQEELDAMMERLLEEQKGHRVSAGRDAPTFDAVYVRRLAETMEDAAIEKRERNSRIRMSFYSSQGNIVQVPGETALGDANDLTSFTTELRPNIVTPISSFFTKSASGAKGSSPLTGIAKGEQSSEEKTMTHLLVRARFPTQQREREDRAEGRHLGYFNLPLRRLPESDLPFLSSSEHPLRRLAELKVGATFDVLQKELVRRPWDLIDPNALRGRVSNEAWTIATTRFLLNRKIISDSPNAEPNVAEDFRQRFIVEVRSLLEYDEDFFDSPNFALENMIQWNSTDRIILALNNCPNRFALQRLLKMIDELGELLVPDNYAEDSLAVSSTHLGCHKLRPLTQEELTSLRRDVANHYMRFQEVYGDAFLEAVSRILELGTYQSPEEKELRKAPFDGYHNLVVFDSSAKAMADQGMAQEARANFALLKNGGYKGGWFEKSMECLEDMPREQREFVARGREVVAKAGWWQLFYEQ